ncbi:MAG: hypothetical protein KAH01_03990, partial [Caldisericia bacterium]|nr:hypothetical protein [Caldisericia bacterium]
MTNQQLKQATIEIRNQLEKEIKGSICSLYPRSSSKTAEEFANDYPHAYNELEKALEENTENQIQALTKELSYTWFNRLCAFRYMDLLHYTPIGVVSGSSNSQLPEMLWETKQGIMPEIYLKSSKSLQLIQSLLDGSTKSSDPDTKMYNVLLQEACHYFNKFMPFLFSSQHSLTDHIVPANLLDSHSVLAKVQELLT